MAGIIEGVKNIFRSDGKMNNLFFIVLDSCRFDSFQAANTPNMDRIGKAEKRYSYASWTSPSHRRVADRHRHRSPDRAGLWCS